MTRYLTALWHRIWLCGIRDVHAWGKPHQHEDKRVKTCKRCGLHQVVRARKRK